MHDGCLGEFSNGQAVLAKIRMMGFAGQYLPLPMAMTCSNCETEFEMETFEFNCPHCGLIHAVTPCHSHDPTAVATAGFSPDSTR